MLAWLPGRSHGLLPTMATMTMIFAAWSPTLAAAPAMDFNKQIRPILSENCFVCHGPDKNNRKAQLRLDIREEAIQHGAIVPGKPNDSELVQRIFAHDDNVMPPVKSHKQLTTAEKETLKQWIASGANYAPHWAYIPPQRPEVPHPKDAAWVRNPIDAFILQGLEARHIQPAPEADKRTLLRRLSLDLTGLPPTPEDMNAFLADKRPDAYERQVDRLLASPHFGERMAVSWLDLARFADTVGYHGDQNINVFPYRDYVIDSFNHNKPFDQFTIEQLAGDLLPNPTVEQRIATGFNRLNMVTREGGAQPGEYLAKYAADRVRTVSATWLGSTMGCAECHDHKFDPFTSRDFYQMEAFFADVKQWGVYQDYQYTPNPELKGWTNDHPFPPELEVESPYLQRRQEQFRQRLAEVHARARARLKTEPGQQAAFEQWRQESLAFLKQWPDGWAVPLPEVGKTLSGKMNENVTAEGVILFQDEFPSRDEIQLPLSPGRLAAIRLELLPSDQHGGSILRREARKPTIQLSATLRTKAGRQMPLAFYHADADHKEPHYVNGAALLGIQERWKVDRNAARTKQTGVWLLETPAQVQEGDVLVISLPNNPAGALRLSVSPFAANAPLEAGGGQALAKELADPGTVPEAYLLGTAWDAGAFAEVRKLQREWLECRGGRALTLITLAQEPRVTRILPRGNWQDQSGAIVQPGTPHFLPPIPNPSGRRLTRLDLARWLVAPDNPLTARTFVNRLWKEFFGTGISSVVDDLGAQGEWPVHPELLDWLAVEFRDSGWDVKHMVRLLVLSSTYHQSSKLRPELQEVDPGNRLLARQTPRRLEAEFVRDNALSIAGLLNPDIGGPSTHPYQPAGYYANLQFPDRDYYPDTDDRQYRRGLYTHWQRTFLHPMLANFDAPSREECTASRVVSNTPQQALTLLNDPTFVEAARVFAQKLLADKTGGDEERLDRAFELALGRPIKARERASLAEFLGEQRTHYRAHPEEAKRLLGVVLSPLPGGVDEAELAAWTTVCRVILNLHETITSY
ncbi:MAG: PSD1 domain-containing protein [Planctomycetes bacterium]|nr:PSD1 domain-containing protein [Planctomycetota bacterium]